VLEGLDIENKGHYEKAGGDESVAQKGPARRAMKEGEYDESRQQGDGGCAEEEETAYRR